MRVPTILSLILANVFHIYVAHGFSLAVGKGVQMRRHSQLPSNHHRLDISLSATAGEVKVPTDSAAIPKSRSNLARRSLTGLALGVAGSSWISSRNSVFAAGFLAASYVINGEYVKMAMPTGPNLVNRLNLVGSLLCHIAAVTNPSMQEAILPVYFGVLMTTLVLFNGSPSTISQIAKALLALVYTGYLPSFWVRLHGLSGLSPGPATIWWTWAAIASSDVGAYFLGNKFGRHKLSTLSAAAGHASPNKSVEGALAGLVCSALVASLGARVLQWPGWMITGPVYGVMLGSLGLVGDLTASVMKRDAGVKDTGSLLPGHGGLLDRFDSYILSAPVAYFFLRDLLPWVDQSRLN